MSGARARHQSGHDSEVRRVSISIPAARSAVKPHVWHRHIGPSAGRAGAIGSNTASQFGQSASKIECSFDGSVIAEAIPTARSPQPHLEVRP